MLDTNVYLKRLQGRVPNEIMDFVDARLSLHSSIACIELAISIGISDPDHPDTIRNRSAVMALLDGIPANRIVAPSPAAFVEAGILAGILARTHDLARSRKSLTTDQACCQDGLRRKLINDTLLFVGACEQGAILVSSNIVDMDRLLQLKPQARLLLFR